ncbi:MAG: hypothetical protein KDD53_07230, partial [Bdellovibrionales bacterium]|nr:hypothetical protein [Bdellovibrionales bacterium]
MKKTYAAIKSARALTFASGIFPLTFRSSLLLLSGSYLLFGPGENDADLVASTLGTSLLCLILIFLIVTAILGRTLRRNLTASVYPPASEELVSKTPLKFFTKTIPIRLPPMFALEMRLRFAQPGVESFTHSIRGFDSNPRLLLDLIQFKHRGIWEVRFIDCALVDLFGFTRYAWVIGGPEVERSLPVPPPEHQFSDLPIISSSVREGDTLQAEERREGDPLDLKPYHPSDGMKKIVWKIFAKS